MELKSKMSAVTLKCAGGEEVCRTDPREKVDGILKQERCLGNAWSWPQTILTSEMWTQLGVPGGHQTSCGMDKAGLN